MKVWDLATRLYHWLQAVLCIALLASGFSGNGPHVQIGLAIFTLVLWRLIWGVTGSQTSRFREFVRSPTTVIRYLRGKESSGVGHNPAGGWMVVMMITALLLQCISGMAIAGFLDNIPVINALITDSIFSVLESMHMALARIIPALVLIHVGAILVYKLRSKPLVLAMFTGVQNEASDRETLYFASNLKALFVLMAALLVTILLVAIA
ncbi:cytochrome b/b6 domain-containing protein [Vibrio sp. TRT 21S02]|uniref:cytochrome b/b6 domain-containing protein n=1 Tax=Vibrio sp. TRT 21S02 TaxID=3418507 RepID=UPI003CF57668